MRFPVGSTVVLREVIGERVRSARPLRVVEDGPHRFIGYLVPRSTVAWPRLIDEEQSQTPDQGWRLPLERWRGPGSLFVVPEGAGFAAVLFFDPAGGQPLSWKVDFFRPLQRRPLGFDTLDHAFDLLADLDGAWRPKDLDDLAQLVRLELLAGPERRAFDAERARVERWLAGGDGPFGDPTVLDWRPDPGWPPLDLPDGWACVEATERAATGQLDVTGPGWRAAQGLRVLDGDGRVHLDLDLAGGALWQGHAPAPIVEAVRRQAGLGWRLGDGHPAVTALRRRLLDAAPAGWALRWLPPGRTAGTDLDEVLRANGWPFDVARAAGAEGGHFGPALFAGLPACPLWLGPADCAPAAPTPPAAPGAAPAGTGTGPDALSAVAALEVLQLADPAVVAATAARAARIRRATGLGGEGPHLRVPPGTAVAGVALPADGRGLLATCADDEDEAELVERLGSARRQPAVRPAARPGGPRRRPS